tara:strand:- start:64 stop:300 length:237 start_codon:yes stop_codon:yes gene_type:complete
MEQTKFELDWSKKMTINGMQSNMGYYNLIISIRDLKIWKAGMRPNRHWKITDVKKYFGIAGNVDTLINRLTDFKEGNL